MIIDIGSEDAYKENKWQLSIRMILQVLLVLYDFCTVYTMTMSAGTL